MSKRKMGDEVEQAAEVLGVLVKANDCQDVNTEDYARAIHAAWLRLQAALEQAKRGSNDAAA